MKLKKTNTETESTGGTVIPDRFKLENVAGSGSPAGGAGVMAAFVCSLVAVVLLGVTAWLMYQNWELIQGV